ncbi:MAG: DNA polymerase III subunit delta [candidate division Zixibacteria bacterium]|nr:DNA polymerase III subunit delta [candidate division Zixibacteria bacterium]
MKPEELVKQLEKRRIAPVYFFSGDEEFLKEEAIRLLIASVVEPGSEAFCLDILSGDTTDASFILTLAATVPMLAERRVVVVRDLQRLSQKDREALATYAEKPTPSTTLVLVAPKVDLNTSVYGRLNTAAVSVVFYPLYADRIPAWLQQRAGQYRKRITPEASERLQAIVGDNLGELAGEVEKLAIFAGNRPVIGLEDVEAAMGPSRAGVVFDLARAIGEKNLAEAHRIHARAIDAGQSPIALVAILVRHFTVLWKIRLMQQDRYPEEEIKKTVKMHAGPGRYYFPQYAAQAKRLAPGNLRANFEALLDADIALKTGARSPGIVMGELLYSLCITS